MFDAARDHLFRLDALVRKWGPLVLLLFAVCYYGQYYRSGLNLGGEGGTIAVNAMRLNEGWLPIKETTLNYNVMWFYPVAWLFKLTGPDYITLRIYFFALCLLTGWIAFLIVRRISGSGLYALGVGLVILAIPGMLFRNYMGLLAVANVWVLLHAFVLSPAKGGRRWAWFGIAGLVFGLTWLVRIDIGMFFSVIYLGLMLLYPFGVRGELLRRMPVALGGGALCLLAAVAIHVPFYVDAQVRGFGPAFVGDYASKWNLIKYEAGQRFFRPSPPARARKPSAAVSASDWIPVRFKKSPPNWANAVKAERAAQLEAQRKGKPRPELRNLFKQETFYDAVFVLILHLPILISAIIIVAAGGVLAWGLCAGNAALKEPALVCLVTLGSALTLFSQYFFFRPDTPHLSEFMIPFLVALACASYYAIKAALASRSWIVRAGYIGFVALCAVSEGLYFYHSFPKESAGTIAAARKRTYEVVAENGVRVWTKRREQPWLQAMHDAIMRYSEQGEWVVTFPYSPTINFMTDRPSYLKDLYVDNATAGDKFTETKIQDIEQYNPAVIVIDQRDINDTEISRFKNWAAPLYDYIRSRYVRVPGEFDSNEIYVRPDRMPPQA
jgi:hypothetical protein